MMQLAKLCQLCYRVFAKERDKLILARMVVNELIQVIRYKSSVPEHNVLMLLEVRITTMYSDTIWISALSQ